jgi:hypothetical protein
MNHGKSIAMTNSWRTDETFDAKNDIKVNSHSVSRMPRARVLSMSGFVARLVWGVALICGGLLAGCGNTAPATQSETKPDAATTAKATTPDVPEEIQSAANTLLGSEAKVLVFGDLAKNGNQEFLAANVLPTTPKTTVPGTVVTRAVVVEKQDGKWTELLHVDEHLKNQKGFLGLTPRVPVTGWRLQYEQDPVQGLQLYFTPESTGEAHVLPIGVRWNLKTKRYQSTDRTFEKFLPEVAQIGDTPMSRLR